MPEDCLPLATRGPQHACPERPARMTIKSSRAIHIAKYLPNGMKDYIEGRSCVARVGKASTPDQDGSST